MSDKGQSRERGDAIRRILMSEGDPIGVNDTPEAADEYDGYIGPVLDLLNARASSDEIAAYLRKVETERMGLTDVQGKPLLPAQERNAAVHSLKLLIGVLGRMQAIMLAFLERVECRVVSDSNLQPLRIVAVEAVF